MLLSVVAQPLYDVARQMISDGKSVRQGHAPLHFDKTTFTFLEVKDSQPTILNRRNEEILFHVVDERVAEVQWFYNPNCHNQIEIEQELFDYLEEVYREGFVVVF